ncbi:DUF3153 domain-containing protein [Schinkia azotoformans]|uniref:Lipoprotein n=1 Tax=Schinkia azotoformans LMG 9581 TaxID=1131731 RepID=K6DQJ4_SCHAZ|nr:DUF3153 domain-containing protein [Schinkia azotoformans]EKN63036.1 hypothetical protein BAZO_18708 [Schinkia azotoformans LMG 9581]MEC1639101.1 DUF3153 domain-containing protein [Schinkia azotoformans]MEC1945130.1 DUF3153 domain-containing protein [Schinkia azotoformans]
MRIKLIVVGVIILFFLTGCVSGVFHVTVNKDGSGELNYRLAIDSDLLSTFNDKNNPLEKFREIAQKDGFIVSNFKDNGYFGVEAKKHVNKISEGIGGELITYISSVNSSKDHLNFIVDKGFFFNIYTIETNVDLTSFAKGNNALFQMFLDKMDLRILLTLPFDVEGHNASRVIDGETDDIKTFEWDLLPGQNNEIYLQAKVLNVLNVVTLVLLAVGLIVFVTVFMAIKRRKSADVKED